MSYVIDLLKGERNSLSTGIEDYFRQMILYEFNIFKADVSIPLRYVNPYMLEYEIESFLEIDLFLNLVNEGKL